MALPASVHYTSIIDRPPLYLQLRRLIMALNVVTEQLRFSISCVPHFPDFQFVNNFKFLYLRPAGFYDFDLFACLLYILQSNGMQSHSKFLLDVQGFFWVISPNGRLCISCTGFVLLASDLLEWLVSLSQMFCNKRRL